jgi:hypothetical protein
MKINLVARPRGPLLPQVSSELDKSFYSLEPLRSPTAAKLDLVRGRGYAIVDEDETIEEDN